MLEVLASSFPVPYHDDFDMFLGPNSCTFRMRGKKSHDLWHFLFLGMCLMHLVFESDDLRVCFFQLGEPESMTVSVVKSFCLKP